MIYQQILNSVATIVVGPPGAITFTNWAALPRDGMYHEILGTRMDQLVPQLNPSFRERGFEGFSAMMADWCGAALRSQKVFELPINGGHNGSNNNGHYRFDAATMQCSIAHQPSDFSDAEWVESKALWIANGGTAASWDAQNINRGYQPGAKTWKDGRWVADHSYWSHVDAEEFGLFYLRYAIVKIDPMTGNHIRLGMVTGGYGSNDVHAFYSPTRKKLYIGADDVVASRYGMIQEVDPITGDSAVVAGISQWYEVERTQIEGTEKHYLYSLYYGARNQTPREPAAWIFDTSNRSAPQVAIPQIDPTTVRTLVHSNATGLLAILGNGRMAQIDMTTGVVTDKGDSGIPVLVLDKQSVKANHTNGRHRLVQIDASNKGFVLLPATDTNAYVRAL